ncbi:TPA: hypothetical protein ACH3X1_004926 [Trebouxia sp. C0004]
MMASPSLSGLPLDCLGNDSSQPRSPVAGGSSQQRPANRARAVAPQGLSPAVLLGNSRQRSGTTRLVLTVSMHALLIFFGFQACISSACSASCSLPCAWEVLLQLRVCASACSTACDAQPNATTYTALTTTLAPEC